jgi:N utilization substance protein A
MSQDLLRIIDSICRDKAIERESFVADLEAAMASAIRKAYDADPEVPVTVRFDPLGGAFSASINDQNISVQELGRIAAQTAKQVIIQKTRERERVSIFEEYSERRGTVVSGTVTRIERGNLIVNLGRAEGFLPRSEQIPGETHQVGDRIRVLILEVREQPAQVKIILSRSHPEFILRLFEVEVPEVAERVIEIKALAREAGYRTKVAVASIDSKVDAVGACVGVRGSRIKNIVEELGGEKIDIVRWNESSQILIQNALKPAEVNEIALCFELGKATVVVAEDQLSLAIGKRGQNVRLAARLTGWDIDIMTPETYDKNLETLSRIVKAVEGVDDLLVDKLVAMGCVSCKDVDDACGEEVIRAEEEKEELAKQHAAMWAAGIEPPPPPGRSRPTTITAADVFGTSEASADESGESDAATQTEAAGEAATAFVSDEPEEEAGVEGGPQATNMPGEGPDAPHFGAGAETVAGVVPEIHDASELGRGNEAAAVMPEPERHPVFPPEEPPSEPAFPADEDLTSSS